MSYLSNVQEAGLTNDKTRDEDPDPVGSVDFLPAESGTFYRIPIRILPVTFRFQVGSVVRSDPRPTQGVPLFGTIHGHLCGILTVPYPQTFLL